MFSEPGSYVASIGILAPFTGDTPTGGVEGFSQVTSGLAAFTVNESAAGIDFEPIEENNALVFNWRIGVVENALEDLTEEVDWIQRRVEGLGVHVGSFDNAVTPQASGNTLLPSNTGFFLSLDPPREVELGDYANVRVDELHGNGTTRWIIDYIASNGTITWEWDLTYNFDVTGLETQIFDAHNLAQAAWNLAESRNRAVAFDTLASMQEWLADYANIALLPVGTALLIRDNDVPDFWWDGTQALELEAKVNLDGYYTKLEIDNLFSEIRSKIALMDIEISRAGNFITQLGRQIDDHIVLTSTSLEEVRENIAERQEVDFIQNMRIDQAEVDIGNLYDQVHDVDDRLGSFKQAQQGVNSDFTLDQARQDGSIATAKIELVRHDSLINALIKAVRGDTNAASSWQEVKERYSSWGDMAAAYSSWSAVIIGNSPVEEINNQITALWQAVNNLENNVNALKNIPIDVYNKPFSNATFSGEVNALTVELRPNLSQISFWGHAEQDATGTTGEDFVILDVADYPIFSRFVGQVDQFAIGYNAATNDFKYVPIRITSQGMEIVTAPNISLGTRFSFQFVLFLADTQTQGGA